MGLFGSKENLEDIRYNAMSMMEKNQPKAAISLFNKILKQNASDIDALLNKGLALNQVKKYSDAITCFDKLIEINPKDAQALNNRGIAMAENGNIQEASECYDKAIEADPKYAPSYFNKGVLLDKLQEHEDALVSLEKAISAESSVNKVKQLEKEGKVQILTQYQLSSVEGKNKIENISIKHEDGSIKKIETNYVLGFFGLIMKLGPIANWRLNLDKKHIPVNT